MWLNSLAWKAYNDIGAPNDSLDLKLYPCFKFELTPIEITLAIIKKEYLYKHNLFQEDIPKIAYQTQENLQELILLSSRNPKNIPAFYHLQKRIPDFFENFLSLLDFKNLDLLDLTEAEKSLVQTFQRKRRNEEKIFLNHIQMQQYVKAVEYFDQTKVLHNNENMQFCYNIIKRLN